MADHSGSGSDPGRARGEELSALLDGELLGGPVERICSEWRTDVCSRDTWHAYSLIGDVMRCEDLAQSCASDEQFLRDFRKRMAAEPVVLAPRPVQHPAAEPAGQGGGGAARRSAGACLGTSDGLGGGVRGGGRCRRRDPASCGESGCRAASGDGAGGQFLELADQGQQNRRRRTAFRGVPRRDGTGLRRPSHSRSAAGSVPVGPQAVCRHLGARADLGPAAQCGCRNS